MRSYIGDRFGGRRALAAGLWHVGRSYLGAFAAYQRIGWSRVSRVVFVCKGNICRSAYAEHRLRTSGGNAVSAGVAADPGKPADTGAQRAARLLGIDLGAHRSRALDDLALMPGDLLVGFEPGHARAIAPMAKEAGAQLTLLGLWAARSRWVYIHDPYGLSDTYFDHCFHRIDRGVAGIAVRLDSARRPTNEQ